MDLLSLDTKECLDVQFFKDLNDLKEAPFRVDESEFKETWDELGDVMAVADYDQYGVVIYGEHIVAYDKLGVADLIDSNRLVFTGYQKVPEFKSRSIIMEENEFQMIVFKNYRLDSYDELDQIIYIDDNRNVATVKLSVTTNRYNQKDLVLLPSEIMV